MTSCGGLFALILFVFYWSIATLESTGGQSVTWYQPFPARTVWSAGNDRTPAEAKVFEGYPVSLNWNFSLTSVTLFSVKIEFNTDTLALSGPGGQAANVEDAFKDRFNFTWTSQQLTLAIFNTTAADDESNGGFRCTLITAEGVWSREIRLKIIEPPKIVDVTSDQDVCEETKVILSCNATGKPEPNITWTRVWENGTDSGALQFKDGYFVMDNIDRSSSGIYRCTAVNGVGEPVNQTVKVIVRFPPTINNMSSCIIYVKEGETKNLACSSAGHPKPNITWTLKGKVQESDGDSLSITPQETGVHPYKCEADNGIENSTEATFVVVVENQAGASLKFSMIYPDKEFTQELNSDRSAKYQEIEEEVQKVKEAFPKCFTTRFKLERFSPINDGVGVVAFFSLIFNATMGAEAATSYLKIAAKEGKLGDVDADSVTHLEAITDPKKCMVIYKDDQLCKTVESFWIVVFVIAGVVIVVLIMLGAYYVIKKRRCRRRDMYDVNSIEKEQADNHSILSDSEPLDDARLGLQPPVDSDKEQEMREMPTDFVVDNSRKKDERKNKKAAEQKSVDDQYAEVDKSKKKLKPGEVLNADLGEGHSVKKTPEVSTFAKALPQNKQREHYFYFPCF